MKKSAGLCISDEIEHIDDANECQRIIKENCSRNSQVEIYENRKIKQILENLISNRLNLVLDVICK